MVLFCGKWGKGGGGWGPASQCAKLPFSKLPISFSPISEGAIGGVEKKRGWNDLTNDTPPKKGFWTPLVRYVFHPPQVSVLCFSCTRIHDRADQKLFWRGPKILRESALSGTFSSPHTFCTPPYHGPIKALKVMNSCERFIASWLAVLVCFL